MQPTFEYAYIKRPASSRARRNTLLTAEIKRIHQETFQVYGYPRITKELPPELKASKHTVYRLMKKNGIHSKTKRKYKATTNSKHNLPVAENLLNREFSAAKPNQKMVSDITYLWTEEGWLYIAGVMDLCGQKIVGLSMGERMTKELVITALENAYLRSGRVPGVLIHSDRGSQVRQEVA